MKRRPIQHNKGIIEPPNCLSAFAQILCGYLIKQHMAPGAGGSARAKWQQRYFVLQGPQLSFYDTKEDYERCRSDNPPMDVTGAIIEDNYAVPEAFSVSFRDDNTTRCSSMPSLGRSNRSESRSLASSSSSMGSSAYGDMGTRLRLTREEGRPPSYGESASSAFQGGAYAYGNSSSNMYGPTGGAGGSRYMQM
ncbi:hypothetical protein PInf_005095 [Phytophthora infestans]|nr:hypothetical protein PInf_005095 [Phytophthora infestans]